MFFIIVYFLEMHGWKQPQEAISGIPLLQAGQHATSWDQLVFILFILESFEEGSCKLFLTELMDSPLSFRSLGWVKSSWIGQSSAQSFWVFFPLVSPLLYSCRSHPEFAVQRPWLCHHTLNLGFIVTSSDPFVHISDTVSCHLDQDHYFFFP